MEPASHQLHYFKDLYRFSCETNLGTGIGASTYQVCTRYCPVNSLLGGLDVTSANQNDNKSMEPVSERLRPKGVDAPLLGVTVCHKRLLRKKHGSTYNCYYGLKPITSNF